MIETRKLVERARGVLMKGGLTEEEAYQKLQKSARDKQTTLRKAAEIVMREGRK